MGTAGVSVTGGVEVIVDGGCETAAVEEGTVSVDGGVVTETLGVV